MLPVLLLAAGVGAGMARQLKPSFTAVGNYAFVYKHADAITAKADPRDSNPLATNNAALLGEAVQNDLLAVSTQARLGGRNSGVAPGQASDGSHYAIILPQASSSYLVQTWGPNANEARTVLDAVLAQATTQATRIQDRAGAPSNSQYSAFVTAPTQVIELPKKSPTKLLIGVMGVGILAGAAMSLLVDRFLTKRAARRGSGRHPRRRHGGSAVTDESTSVVGAREESTPPADEFTSRGAGLVDPAPGDGKSGGSPSGSTHDRAEDRWAETTDDDLDHAQDDVPIGQALRS